MNKEKGFVQISLLIQIFIVSLIIAGILMLAHLILTGLSYLTFGLFGGDKMIPGMLGGLVEALQNLVIWSLSGMVKITQLAQIAGWDMIRDLANIFLVLGLIIIALGIILGIKEYEAKKTLPILIIIALLINFTPVICGAIVDFSNYLISWLISGATPGGEFSEELIKSMSDESILDQLAHLFILFYFAIIAIIVYFFYFLLFLIRQVYLLILVIFSPMAFASRVFGPSEKLKKFFPSFLYWDNWWSAFLEWCTIGLFGAFFLFIANKLIINMPILKEGYSGVDIGAWGGIIVYFFPILLLLLGFFASLEAAKAAVSILPGMGMLLGLAAAGALKGAKFAGKKASEAIPERTRRWGERQARYLPPGALYGRGEAGPKGWVKRRLGEAATAITSPYWISRRGFGRSLTVGMEAQMSDIPRAEKEGLGMTIEQNLRAFRETPFRGEKTGYLEALIDKHEIDDARSIMPEKERKQFDEEVKGQMGEAAMVSRGSFMKIARAFPHLVDETVEKLSPEIREKMLLPEEEELKKKKFTDKKGEASYAMYIGSGMKPEHVEYTDAEALFGSPEERELAEKEKKSEKINEKSKKMEQDIQEAEEEGREKDAATLKKEKEKLAQELQALTEEIKKSKQALAKIWDIDIKKEPEKLGEELTERSMARDAFWEGTHKFWAGYHDEEAIKTFKWPFAERYMEMAKNEKGAVWYVVNNPLNASYLASIFAPESGFFMPEGVTLAEINDWRERLNKFDPEEMKKLQEAIEELTIETRRALTQSLRIDSNRIGDLREKDAEDIKRLLNEWMTTKKGR